MKREFAETGLLSLIALINEANGCDLNDIDYEYTSPFTYSYETTSEDGTVSEVILEDRLPYPSNAEVNADSLGLTPSSVVTGPPPLYPTTNTMVMITKKLDRHDTRKIYYHRISAHDLFADTTIEFAPGIDVPNEDEQRETVKNLLAEYGIPFDEKRVTFGANDRYMWVDFNVNYILWERASIPIITDTHLSRVIKVLTIPGYLEALDVGNFDPWNRTTFIANVNKVNGGTDYSTSNMYWGKPETISDTTPTDRVLITAPGINVPYYGKVYFYYDRYPFDLEYPEGIYIGDFDSLAAFEKATPRYDVYLLLNEKCGYKLGGSEWVFGEYEESDTYPHYRLEIIFDDTSYAVKTVGKLYVVGGRTA